MPMYSICCTLLKQHKEKSATITKHSPENDRRQSASKQAQSVKCDSHFLFLSKPFNRFCSIPQQNALQTEKHNPIFTSDTIKRMIVPKPNQVFRFVGTSIKKKNKYRKQTSALFVFCMYFRDERE